MVRVVTNIEMPRSLHGDEPKGINADLRSLRELYLLSPVQMTAYGRTVEEDLFYDPESQCAVAYDKAPDGRKLEGFVQYRLDEDRSSARIDNMYVANNKRKRGAGRALVEKVVEEARQRGIEEVQLYSTQSAEKIYKRLGFTVVRRPGSELTKMRISTKTPQA